MSLLFVFAGGIWQIFGLILLKKTSSLLSITHDSDSVNVSTMDGLCRQEMRMRMMTRRKSRLAKLLASVGWLKASP